MTSARRLIDDVDTSNGSSTGGPAEARERCSRPVAACELAEQWRDSSSGASPISDSGIVGGDAGSKDNSGEDNTDG
ncbi:hypothetical protein Scep_014984 [Stephania cephalantha]|uniref:Uncharacterized protein n=1 Tax=Stephania cephalantha TaxID=152367 RepID=A0AAP0J482_9MAGN